MSHAEEILDLDYDSPLETLFWFLGSPWCMGGSFLFTWFLLVSPGKNGRPPIWAEFPVFPFFLGMLCLWALGFWLKANYDVRYQLNSRTQQLELVRKIFGQTFKSRVAEFSQLHAVGLMTTWSDDKQGNRSWEYAVCLVTKAARLVRVSSFETMPPTDKSAEVARSLGIIHFPCQLKAGKLYATRARDGKVTLGYKAAPKAVSGSNIAIALLVTVLVILVFCLAMSR